LVLIPNLDVNDTLVPELDKSVIDFVTFTKDSLGDIVSDVRVSERLADSAICLIAPEDGANMNSKGCSLAQTAQNRHKTNIGNNPTSRDHQDPILGKLVSTGH